MKNSQVVTHRARSSYNKPVLMVWIILILTASAVLAQSAPQKNQEALDIACARRESAVQISKSIAATVLNCEDRWVKIPALARLAEALWKDDEGYARRLFTRTLELCNPVDAPAEQQPALFNLRQQVLALLARRDAKLAQRLVNANALLNGAENGSKSTEANFQIADRLVNTAPETAKEFAERSLETGLSPAMGFFLSRLRLRDERAADQLFLQALNYLSTGRATDVESLLLLGTYV